MYYLSQPAYDGLCKMAQRAGYVPPDAKRMDGLSMFIDALSRVTFTDSRPDEYKEADAARMHRGRPGLWRDGDARAARKLQLSDETVCKLAELGVHHVILPSLTCKNLDAIASRVLEAIGIGYLTPDMLPAQPIRKRNAHSPLIPSKRRKRVPVVISRLV